MWCIVDSDPPIVQCKRTRRSYKTVKARKCRQPQKHAVEQTSKRKRANSPVGNEPRDSGVHSENSSSGSSGGYSGSSGSSSGSFAGGSSSTGGSGGQGNSGGDDGDKKKEFPQWCLPGHQNNAAKKMGKKKRAKQKDDEEKDSVGEEKMDVDDISVSNATGFQMFLPSKVDNEEQCHSPGEGDPSRPSGKVAYQ